MTLTLGSPPTNWGMVTAIPAVARWHHPCVGLKALSAAAAHMGGALRVLVAFRGTVGGPGGDMALSYIMYIII
jgi:hypothetical protein